MSEEPMQAPQTSKELPGAFQLIKPSFNALILNIFTFLPLILIPLVLGAGSAIFTASTKDSTVSTSFGTVDAIGLVGLLIVLFASLLIGPIVTYIQIKSARGEKVTFSNAVKNALPALVDFFFAGIIIAIIIMIGFILLIIPGIFFLQRLYLTPYFVVDKRLGIMPSIKASWDTAKQNPGAIWGVLGVNLLFSIIQIVPIIGALIGGVLGLIYSFAPAIRYNQLTSGHDLTSTPTKA